VRYPGVCTIQECVWKKCVWILHISLCDDPLLQPNGRFEINKKICLSMSAYHPELWQPSWSIRTALLAIIGFMPTDGTGAIGALDYPEQEKRRLANLSIDWKCPTCGMCNRTALLEGEDDESLSAEAADIASQMSFKSDGEVKEALKKMSPQEEKKSRPREDESTERDGDGGLTEETETLVRQRQPQQPLGNALTRQGSIPGRRATPPTQPRPQAKGTASLVVMWLLLLMIFILLARRAYKYFPDAAESVANNKIL
jgi:ubiquitin-conjugating enzyme E2 J1